MKTTTISKRFVALICCLAVCVALIATALGVNLASRAQAEDAQEESIELLEEEPADAIQVIEEEMPDASEGVPGGEAYEAGETAATEDAVAAEEEPAYVEPDNAAVPEETGVPEDASEPENPAEPDGTPEEANEPEDAEPSGSEEPAETEAEEPEESAEPGDAADAEPDGIDAADEEGEPEDIDADDEAVEDIDAEDADAEEDAVSDEDDYGIMLLGVVNSGECGADGNNVTWVLDDEGVLTISGEGAMKNGVKGSSSPWYDDRESIKSVIIEDGVTTIGAYAFYGCTNLTEITIPNSVTSIGARAFYGCTSLGNISIPDNVNSIGQYAFCDCSNLTNISGLNGVITLDNYVFQNCSALTSIEMSNVTSIGICAFDGCSSLIDVVLSNSLTEIGSYAFRNCTSLVSIDLPAGITEIVSHVFDGCSSLISVAAQGTITSIETYAFRGCTSLESVFDLSHVTFMHTYAFYNCSSLTGTIDLSSLETIPEYAFYGCSSITGVIFSDQLTAVNAHAFQSCSHITTLSLPEGLQTIGDYAFWNCWLNDDSMTATTTVSAGAALYTKDSGETIQTAEELSYTGHTLYIPSSVTSIGKNAFEYSYVDVFVIGSNLTSVDGSAFASYSVEAVIFNNFQDLVYITNFDQIWSRLDSNHAGNNVNVVYRLGGTGVYLNGVTGDDNNDGSFDSPVATYVKAQELAKEAGVSYIMVTGTVTVSDTQTWDGSLTLYRDTSFTDSDLVVVSGNGDLTLADITIDGQNIESSGSLILVQGEGAQLTITDGAVIQNALLEFANTMNTHNHGAVCVRNGTLTMTGGEIRNNTGASFGGGVALLGNVSGTFVHMEFTGGTISGNSSNHGGGIYLYGNATLTMDGGTVSNNTATEFGGGIYVGSGAVAEISAGYITNNRQTTSYTTYGGGGIYVNQGANDWGAGTCYLYNVEITDNSFTAHGDGLQGTIACCETGTLEVYITKGAVIHDNSENKTFYVTRDEGSLAFTLPAIMLGGGAYNWVDATTGEPLDLDKLVNDTEDVYAITYVSTSDGTVTGLDRCTTFITGNTAVVLGSAIGTNGNVIIGYNDGDVSIEIEKQWNIGDNALPESITVYVDATDGSDVTTRIGSVVLNEENGWKVTIDELPKYDSDGLEYTYSVSEEIPDGMICEITGGKTSDDGDTASYVFTITNSYETEISVSKVWDDTDDVDGIRPASVEVELTSNGDAIDTQTLSADNGWTYTWSGLPVYKDNVAIEYAVSETVTPDGYSQSDTGLIQDADGNYSIVFTNTHTPTRDLTIQKDVAGNGDTSTYEFEITLTQNGVGFEGELTLSNGDTMTFTDGKGTLTVAAGEALTISGIPYGLDCSITELTTGADSVVVTDGNGNVIASVEGTETQAMAEIGTIHESSQVTFTNSYRAYFPIDEEIVPDESDRSTWVKDESVNEYNAIEIEMSTYLPVVTAYDIANGDFTMNFHEQLDSQLVLDEVDADFSVAIAGYRISHDYYTVTIDPDDGCTFHVDVDLTALYNDGIISEEDLQGDTEIMVFFFADLEGTGLNGTYSSTVWYDIYDADEILYISNVDVVYVYTYEIEILKVDAETGEALSGATLGVYYDRELSEPVSRNGEPYTVTSEDDGYAMFYGLADGTYYIAEVAAPDGYLLSTDVLEVVLNENTVDDNYIYSATFDNTPIPETIGITVYKVWDDADDQDGLQPDSITVQLLANGDVIDTQVLSADNGWSYSWSGLDAYENGEAISYSVIEPETPEGYSQSDTGLVDNGDGTYSVTITNTHTPDGEIPEPKKSVDVGDGTEVAPGDSLVYTITYTNGNEDDATITITDVLDEGLDFVSATDGGTYDEATRTITWVISGVAANAEGSVSFTAIVNESALVPGEVINTADVQINENPAMSTNTVHNPVKVETTVTFEVVKVWDDNNDLYGARPDLVVVVLLENGKATTLTQLLSAENSWTGTFSDLPEYDENGEKIVYSIAEVTVPNYSSTITGDQESGFTVTNLYDFEKITNPEPDNPEPGVPQTGQDTLPIAPLAISGAAIVAAGIALLVVRRRRAA